MHYFEVITSILSVVIFSAAGVLFLMKKRIEYFKKENKKLQNISDKKDDLLTIASHEIRTPMAVVKGYTDFLLMGDYGELTDDQRVPIKRVNHNTEGLLRMVDKILDMSRLESNKMKFLFEHFELKNFIESLVNDFSKLCESKNINLTFSNPEALDPLIFTDQEKLKCILQNLLGNAYKFTPFDGSIDIKITSFLSSKKLGKFIKISVSDTGCGISKDEADTIFEKFHMAHEREYEGTGLGLNIVKKLIDKLGGKIWVESKEGAGATFEFLLSLEGQKTAIQSELVNYE